MKDHSVSHSHKVHYHSVETENNNGRIVRNHSQKTGSWNDLGRLYLCMDCRRGAHKYCVQDSALIRRNNWNNNSLQKELADISDSSQKCFGEANLSHILQNSVLYWGKMVEQVL